MKYFLLMEKASLFALILGGFTGFAQAGISGNALLKTPNKIVNVSYSNAFSAEDVRGISGKNVKVKVTFHDDTTTTRANKLWFRIIGLPEELRFTKGAMVGGIWFIGLQDLPELYLTSPENFNGSFLLNIFLMRENKAVVSIIAKKTIKVSLVENAASTATRAIKDIDKPTQVDVKDKLPEFEEVILLERGRQLLKKGEVLQARNVYKELADRGSAKGALALAQSYEAKGNLGMADQWYKRAKQLGSSMTH